MGRLLKGQGPGLVNVLWARARKHVFVVKATLAHTHNSEIAREIFVSARNGTNPALRLRPLAMAHAARVSAQWLRSGKRGRRCFGDEDGRIRNGDGRMDGRSSSSFQ